jgi:hypothetical protein
MMGREPPQVDAFADTWMAAPTTPGGLAVQPGARAPLPDATSAGLLLLLYSAALDPAPAAGPPACWARAQLRYALGAAGRSLVVGWGPGPPLRAASPAASCAASVRPCNGTRAGSAALAAAAPNPHVLVGALVAGPAAGAGDAYEDVRAAPDAALSLDAGSGFAGALALAATQRDWAAACDARPGLVGALGARLPRRLW